MGLKKKIKLLTTILHVFICLNLIYRVDTEKYDVQFVLYVIFCSTSMFKVYSKQGHTGETICKH